MCTMLHGAIGTASPGHRDSRRLLASLDTASGDLPSRLSHASMRVSAHVLAQSTPDYLWRPWHGPWSPWALGRRAARAFPFFARRPRPSPTPHTRHGPTRRDIPYCCRYRCIAHRSSTAVDTGRQNNSTCPMIAWCAVAGVATPTVCIRERYSRRSAVTSNNESAPHP